MVNTITYGLPHTRLAALYRAPETDADDARKTPADDTSDRTIRDTIEISPGGQKIINLARGAELASALPDARADRAAFDAALKQAQEDIKRITTLFGGVLNPFGVATAASQTTESDAKSRQQVFAEALRQAFSDFRKVTAEVDDTLQRRKSEF